MGIHYRIKQWIPPLLLQTAWTLRWTTHPLSLTLRCAIIGGGFVDTDENEPDLPTTDENEYEKRVSFSKKSRAPIIHYRSKTVSLPIPIPRHKNT